MKLRVGLGMGTMVALLAAQTQVDLGRQVRNVLPFSSGGTNASTQTGARASVGPAYLVATDFTGADIGAQVNNAFASFGTGQCGTVAIPTGSYTYSSGPIFVPTGCTLTGTGFSSAATKLRYSGPPATSAIVMMQSDYTPAFNAVVENLHIQDGNSTLCPNNGMLAWDSGAAAWRCYDGATYTPATVHLAAVQHGQINPSTLSDGAHLIIRNVDIDGDAQGVFPNQGGFHFGVYLNGCEECSVENVVVHQADDGFYVGKATNGVLFHQITARINRRAGFHYRGPSHFLCNECLFEANHWVGQPIDPAKYGAGVRGSNENTSPLASAAGGKFVKTYFEANWVDLFSPGPDPVYSEVDGFHSIRGVFAEAKWTNCTIPDASLLTLIPGNTYINGCQTTGSFTLQSPQTQEIVWTDSSGTLVRKVQTNVNAVSWGATYELRNGGADRALALSDTGPPGQGTVGLLLGNIENATATTGKDSAFLQFQPRRWTGSASQTLQWWMRGTDLGSGETGVVLEERLNGLFNGVTVAAGSNYMTTRFKQMPGQTQPVTEWRNSSGAVMAAVTANGALQLGSVPQADLGAPANGTLLYCQDCNQDSTCTAGGSGALAKRIAGSWRCN